MFLFLRYAAFSNYIIYSENIYLQHCTHYDIKNQMQTRKNSSTVIQDFTGWLHAISLNFFIFYHICHIPLYIVLLQFTKSFLQFLAPYWISNRANTIARLPVTRFGHRIRVCWCFQAFRWFVESLVG